jgi:hypothetical protein
MNSNPILQVIPGLAVITIAVIGAGVLPNAVERLYQGKPRKVGRDRWDFEMDKRDERLLLEARNLSQSNNSNNNNNNSEHQ